MAYNFVTASSQYLSTASAPASGAPMTLAAWGKTSTRLGFQAVITVGQNSGTNRNQIQFGQSSDSHVVSSTANGAITSATILGTSDCRNGQWNHICGLFTSATSRSIFFNGASENTNTTDIGSQNAATNVNIGVRTVNNAVGGYFDGDLAEIGIWNVALTAAEIASLAKGMTCNLVRPQSLVFYAPLIRNLQDLKGGLTLTNNNTATVANHPRVYR